MNTDLMFSSATPEWETPQDLFDELDKEFGFALDVCAQPHNAKCGRYFSPETDGLAQDWASKVCWMNPPYGREIGKWVAKAKESSRKGATVVMLLPARTDTAWWHDYIWDTENQMPQSNTEVRLLRGRLKFGGHSNCAPFPSAIVIFKAVRGLDEVAKAESLTPSRDCRECQHYGGCLYCDITSGFVNPGFIACEAFEGAKSDE